MRGILAAQERGSGSGTGRLPKQQLSRTGLTMPGFVAVSGLLGQHTRGDIYCVITNFITLAEKCSAGVMQGQRGGDGAGRPC
jgi:hypothetical protein